MIQLRKLKHKTTKGILQYHGKFVLFVLPNVSRTPVKFAKINFFIIL